MKDLFDGLDEAPSKPSAPNPLPRSAAKPKPFPRQDAELTGTCFAQILERLDQIEMHLSLLITRNSVKEFYNTAEVAKILGKAEFTVREWCRLSRIHAEKRNTGRGKHQEWIISREELKRIENEGLLPTD